MSNQTKNNLSEDSIRKFCKLGTRHRDEEFQRWFGYVVGELTAVNNDLANASVDGENIVHTYLVRERRFDDLNKFGVLNRKLQANSIMKRTNELLHFLVKICEERKNLSSTVPSKDGSFNRSSRAHLTSVTPKSISLQNGLISPARPPTSLTPEKNATTLSQSRRNSVAETVIPNSNKANFPRAPEGHVSERAVLQELLYAFQGIGGEIFKDDLGSGAFRISTRVSAPLAHHAAHLATLGTLHVYVRKMVESVPLVGAPTCLTALATAMRLQLNEFCRLISELESQLYQKQGPQLTLLRVRAVTGISQIQMKWLATAAEVCKDKKGGALLTALHGLMQHGDVKVKAWLGPLLTAASRPFYEMLAQWLKEGHIDDPFSEFFIAIDSEASRDQFWHHKFSIRESMRPSFISKSQAGVVLATGKSVALLPDLCGVAIDPLKWAGLDAALKLAGEMDAQSLWAVNGELQTCLDSANQEVSQKALSAMLNEGKLSLHLQAFKNYLLLGQGDFVQQLMQNLAPELSQPASNLSTSRLTPLLDSAIRSTNAQFDNPDILERLDVKLMQISPGELGWDTFTLRYSVDGPIAMIFTNEVITKYLCLFNALWRAKRMEWVLSNLWKQQTISTRLFRKVPELTPVFQDTLLLISEMNQLIRQMQYYLLFESIECQWSELQEAVSKAPSLDHLIRAHDRFLTNVMRMALLDEDSVPLIKQLRSVYNSVLQLQSIEAKLSDIAYKELHRRNALLKEAEMLEKQNKFGGSTEMDNEERKIRKVFRMHIKTIRRELRSLAKSYQDLVKLFLLELAKNKNEELNLLSYRLDFNEHYKKSDERLSTSLTLDFRRRSGRSDMESSQLF